MVAVEKSRSGKGDKSPSSTPKTGERSEKAAAVAPTEFNVQDRLARARANRSQAETARQKIITEIMKATRDLYEKLVDEGAETLEKAKQTENDAELRHLEAIRELEHSNNIHAEADAYREKVVSDTRQQAQEMLRQAQTIKGEAVAFREKLLEQVRQQAKDDLEQAQSDRLEADAYLEKVIAQAQRQAQDILEQARSTADQEGAQIVQKYSIEAERILAEAELVKAAAQEQLEAQKLYAEMEELEAESREVLERARAKLTQEPALVEYDSAQEDETVEPTPEPALAEDHADQEYSVVEPVPEPSPEPASNHPVRNETQQYERLLKLGYSLASAGLRVEGLASEELPAGHATESSESPAGEDGAENFPEPSGYRVDLPDNELVLGLEIGSRSKAYPLRVVTEAKTINDSLNNEDVLVTFGPPSELGMIFKRKVEGRSLTFEALAEATNGLMLMKDRETGTTWEALTGRAISGPLVKSELKRLTPEYSFWFAWSELHPHTEIYQPEPGVEAASSSL